jgi:hypothetical protein
LDSEKANVVNNSLVDKSKSLWVRRIFSFILALLIILFALSEVIIVASEFIPYISVQLFVVSGLDNMNQKIMEVSAGDLASILMVWGFPCLFMVFVLSFCEWKFLRFCFGKVVRLFKFSVCNE